jgi:hypothetical protein
MLDFIKNAFRRKAEPKPEPKPKKLVKAITELIARSVEPDGIISNFPEDKKAILTRELYDGLQAGKRYGKRMKRTESQVNLIKINNLFTIIVKYSHNIDAKGVPSIKEDERL